MWGLLANLISLAVPSPLAKLAEQTRPNPYAPNVPDQAAIARNQQVSRRGLRPGLSGLAGSEEEWSTDQGMDTIGVVGTMVQDVTSAKRYPSRFNLRAGIHGDPGADGTPTTLADFDRRPQGAVETWAGQTRTVQNGANSVRRGTLLEPTAKTPTARQMAAGQAATAVPASSGDALDGYWS